MGKKALRPVNDKQQRPQGNKRLLANGDKSESSIQELAVTVEAALALLDSQTADEIIGEPDDAYRALIQGVRAAVAIEWSAAKMHGLRQTPNMLRYGAQTLTMLLTLVHYAYALGIKRGREEAAGG